MRIARHLTFAILTMLMAGCALVQRRPVAWPLPDVREAPMPGRLVQTLILERQGRSLELLAVIETGPESLTLVGMSPLGQRLVRITWTGGKVNQETDPNLPVKVDGEAILRDVVFANWSEAGLQKVFAGTGWTARFDGPRRTLAWNGRPWLEVRPDSSLAGTVVVDHIAEAYRVRVNTVERSAP